MERGPTALFGAIVAVGVGPALWLGVQLSAGDAPAGKPPATVRQQVPAAAETDQGGSGAGEESDETGVGPVADAIEPAAVTPIVTSVSPSAVVSPSPSASASPSAQISTEPVRSTEPSVPPVAPSIEPSTEDSSQSPPPPAGGAEASGSPSVDASPVPRPDSDKLGAAPLS